MADSVAPAQPTAEQAAATMRSRRFVVLLVLVSAIGVGVSVASWGFLELVYQVQREMFTHLPHALGYRNGPPLWWSLPVLGIGASITALAITILPGEGGHLPAKGLAAGGPPKPLRQNCQFRDTGHGSGPGCAHEHCHAGRVHARSAVQGRRPTPSRRQPPAPKHSEGGDGSRRRDDAATRQPGERWPGV